MSRGGWRRSASWSTRPAAVCRAQALDTRGNSMDQSPLSVPEAWREGAERAAVCGEVMRRPDRAYRGGGRRGGHRSAEQGTSGPTPRVVIGWPLGSIERGWRRGRTINSHGGHRSRQGAARESTTHRLARRESWRARPRGCRSGEDGGPARRRVAHGWRRGGCRGGTPGSPRREPV